MTSKNTFTTLLILMFMLNAIGINGQVSFGKPELINKGWFFNLKHKEDRPVQQFNSKEWQKIDLPHDWSVRQQLSPTLASATGFLPGGTG